MSIVGTLIDKARARSGITSDNQLAAHFHRITPHRLAGLLWRDAMEVRRAGLRSRKEAEKRVLQGRVKVVVVELADWHARHFGSRAG